MIQDIPWKMLEKYFANESDTLENHEVQSWLDSASENKMIFEQLQNFYQKTGSLPLEFVPDTKAALKKVSAKIQGKHNVFQLSGIWWKVASVLIIGIFVWWQAHQQANKPLAYYENLLKSDSIPVNVLLPDGSHIWLNTHSSMKYPKQFEKSREVYLEGEAYFEIAHDARHAFIIHTQGSQVRVIGTKFDIRSYLSEEQVVVTVAEGIVGFGSDRDKQVILTKNQKGIMDKVNGNLIKAENNDSNFMAWKTLEFQFDKQPLETVIKSLAEAYHFNYRFNIGSPKERLLTANFDHRSLAEIMETISLAANVKIILQNGQYTIQ